MRRIKVRNYRVITLSLLLGLSMVGLSLMLARPPVVKAAPITVTSGADNGPGTLRQAIIDASSGDTINFAPGLTTINLTSGELVINKSLTINGPGANLLTVQRNTTVQFRIFNIASGNFNVTISGLTIANGGSNGGGGGIVNQSSGTLTIMGCTISRNFAGDFGGGIASFNGTLTVTNSTISNNQAGLLGGGIYGSNVTITNSTISANSALVNGGGIYTNSGTVNLTNSTISGNSASGGVGQSGGGGIYNDGGTVNARNTIIARNTATIGPDFSGGLTSQGYNLIGNTSGMSITTGASGTTTGNQLNVDPGLELDATNKPKLAYNGGPTKTIALVSGSTAIERGHSSGSNTDQRGFARPVVSPATVNPIGDGSDIGAYEMQANQLPGCDTINLVVNNNNDGGSGSLRDVITNACAGSTIIFGSNVRGAIDLTSGELLINKSLTINGPGANALTVRRAVASNFRIFNIAGGNFNVTISGLTINFGTSFQGGGIFNNSSSLTVMGCAISSNGGTYGGGIYNSFGVVNINNSTISGNTPSGYGGGIFNGGTVTIANSTISANFATNNDGGGIFNNGGNVSITNSTISNNRATNGSGGGINNLEGTVNARNTIIAGNTAGSGPDFFGALTSQNFNLIGNSDGQPITPVQTSDRIGTPGSPIDPRLGQLGDNGGPTMTHALLTNSPASSAIDRGNSSGSNTDQRGFTRPLGSANATGGNGSDIGAFEVQAAACSYSIAPTSNSVSAAAATGSANVTAGAGCTWTAASNSPSFINITSSGGGTGNGAVNYSVAANTGPARNGTLTIAGQTFTVAQASGCTFAISPSAQNFSSSGGTSSANVTAGAGCAWTAASNSPSFINITSGASGTDNGAVNYSVAANANTSQRTGTMTIAGQTFTVTQDGAVPTPSPSPSPSSSPTPTPTNIQFSTSLFVVGEGDQRVTLTVTRSGNTSGAASAGFVTSDSAGSQNCSVFNAQASSRCDYLTSIGPVQFAAGESSRTFSIPIIDDSYAEGNETFTVSLNNASGATLGTQSTTAVMIVDNETTTGPNPIDQSSFYVRQHYLDFLSREPDTGGLNFWVNNIESCGADANCREVKRIDTSVAFFLSIEFQGTGYLVERIYKASYGDATGASTFPSAHQLAVPIVRLNEFLPDTQEIGRGVVVGQTGWEAALENNKQAFTLEFVQRSQFMTAFPASMTPSAFVDKLFLNAAVTPQASARAAAINEFGAATTTADVAARSRAMRDVADNSTLNQQEFNRAFVLMQFLGYLRRNPNDPQDTDYTGYDFWLTKLNQFNGNYVSAEMVKAFISSTEYRQRFGP
jgi:hypothetical protein